MKQVISLLEILGNEIRSRKNANTITQRLDGRVAYVLDLRGVSFISRSFADELLNIEKAYAVTIVNAEGEVKTILDIVRKSRENHSVKSVKRCDTVKNIVDMPNLSRYLSTF